ncbi:hypothetical protein JCM15640A_10130 [Hoylesella timonensis 4401737 = DSM 22865 = JCM 15640]
MYKIIASLYRYNMRGFNKSIPYFATLSNILVLFIFIYFLIICLLDTKSIFDIWHADSKGEMYLIGALLVVPLYSLAWFLFPERKMKEHEALLTKKEYRLGLFFYVFLVIFLMVLLFIVAKARV